MRIPRGALQWGGFVAVAIIADAAVQPQGYLQTVLLGLVLIVLYFPVLSYLSKRVARSRSGASGGAEGSNVTVRRGRLSGTSSILMIALGVFTLFFVSGFFGLILVVIGLVMYRFYRRGAVEADPKPPVQPGAAN